MKDSIERVKYVRMSLPGRRSNMKSEQAHLLVLIAVTSGVSVLAVLLTALISVAIVQAVKSFFVVVVQLISFVLEVLVAVVAAITSGKKHFSRSFG